MVFFQLVTLLDVVPPELTRFIAVSPSPPQPISLHCRSTIVNAANQPLLLVHLCHHMQSPFITGPSLPQQPVTLHWWSVLATTANHPSSFVRLCHRSSRLCLLFSTVRAFITVKPQISISDQFSRFQPERLALSQMKFGSITDTVSLLFRCAGYNGAPSIMLLQDLEAFSRVTFSIFLRL